VTHCDTLFCSPAPYVSATQSVCVFKALTIAPSKTHTSKSIAEHWSYWIVYTISLLICFWVPNFESILKFWVNTQILSQNPIFESNAKFWAKTQILSQYSNLKSKLKFWVWLKSRRTGLKSIVLCVRTKISYQVTMGLLYKQIFSPFFEASKTTLCISFALVLSNQKPSSI